MDPYQTEYLKLLTIGGSDCGGCAGIQADIKTFSALGCFGMSAIVALTAQNTQGVLSIFPVSPSFVADQLDAIFQDIGVDGIKIGMLHTKEIIEVVAEKLEEVPGVPIVLDPVIVAASGDLLLEEEAIELLRTKLFSKAAVVTPNHYEAEALIGRKIGCKDDTERAAIELLDCGAEAILIKGGHHRLYRSRDCLAIQDIHGVPEIVWFDPPPVETPNTHGAGCTYASAIASELARGRSLREAVKRAKRYLTAALQEGAKFSLGQGRGPVHHFHHLWSKRRLELPIEPAPFG